MSARRKIPSCLDEAVLTRIYHELLSRDHETGNPLAGLSGAQRARRRWACHRATRPAVPRDWSRGVPAERYVAGTDTRGRREGRPYPWSQQVIHEISGLREKCTMFNLCTSFSPLNSSSFGHLANCFLAFWPISLKRENVLYNYHNSKSLVLQIFPFFSIFGTSPA